MVAMRILSNDASPAQRRLEAARQELEAAMGKYQLAAAAVEYEARTNPTSPLRPQLLTQAQAAERLGCSESYVKGLLAKGELTRLKQGDLTRISEQELADYIGRLGG
jgi:excisionase family DNA binding protein